MITFSAVSKTYADGTEALKSLNFQVEEGEFFVLIGPSGCGKTTTMKLVNRLIEPTEGEIRIRDREIHHFDIHELRWNIGYVLQQIALFPHMNVAENIAVVPEMRKWDKGKIRRRTDELLDMVGLDPATYRSRRPSELSGGEQQRVGVVRALAADPDIILMDEPFSALDPISRERLQKDIQKLQQEIKKTIIFVTHDMDEALALGDRVCLMKKGAICQIDTPQNLIHHPADDFVRRFIGDRKSPWRTAVDVIADGESPWIIREDALAKKEEKTGPFYVIDGQGRYRGRWNRGEWLSKGPALDNHLPLQEALARFRKNELERLPVVKGDRLVGVLSYKNMVDYLERTNREGGEASGEHLQ
ncbi:ABC transporter ATP-binding protein [Salinithrix halophila]|uniref:ABC transporter ATP-binding protein n=1 Tax=Salinithrix halophila TaxID=1485204 RepID=A0ABV8J8Y2_9BACL